MISTRKRPLLLGAPFLPALSTLAPASVKHSAQGAASPVSEHDLAGLVAGNTTFAFGLYHTLRQDSDGNLIFSPYSISLAFAMTYAGAGGETAAQMADVLSYALPEPYMHEAFSTLSADLIERGGLDDERGTLRLANALWGEQTYPFNQSYLDQVEANYGAALRLTDFRNAPEDAREEINDWVEDQTEDRIQDIVPAGAIDEGTRLVLANAVYFYGPWWSQFSPETTRDDDFFLLNGTPVTVPLMVQEVSLPHTRGDGFQAVELPYDSSGLAMTIILPDRGRYEDVEEALNASLFEKIVQDAALTDVRIYLPRFEFEFGAARLKDILSDMGMPDPFNAMRADFLDMTDFTQVGLDQRLFVTEALHKAFISVDENGTEAAAATVILMATAGASPGSPEEPLEVRIDRPFLFAIRDTVTGTLLFLGRVMDPHA